MGFDIWMITAAIFLLLLLRNEYLSFVRVFHDVEPLYKIGDKVCTTSGYIGEICEMAVIRKPDTRFYGHPVRNQIFYFLAGISSSLLEEDEIKFKFKDDAQYESALFLQEKNNELTEKTQRISLLEPVTQLEAKPSTIVSHPAVDNEDDRFKEIIG